MRKVILGAMLTFLGTPALAAECPSIWKQINDKMGTAQLSEADKVKLSDLRKQGEDLHHTGDHAKSAETLKQALALLG